jgi:hypothetical protein
LRCQFGVATPAVADPFSAKAIFEQVSALVVVQVAGNTKKAVKEDKPMELMQCLAEITCFVKP